MKRSTSGEMKEIGYGRVTRCGGWRVCTAGMPDAMQMPKRHSRRRSGWSNLYLPDLSLPRCIARSQLHMLAWETDPAIEWGELAIRLAEELNEDQTLAHALSNVGAALMMFPDQLDRAEGMIRRALDISRRENHEKDAARAYALLSSGRSEMYRFEATDPILQEGIAYVAEHDIDAFQNDLCAWRGASFLYQGHWAEAAEQALDVLRRPQLATISRIVALAVLGRVRVRQGDPATAEPLEVALELATGTGELQRLCPVRTARAELAWLAGDLDGVRAEVIPIYDAALRSGHRWYIGQLAYWLWRAGALDCLPEPAFENPLSCKSKGSGRKRRPSGVHDGARMKRHGLWQTAVRSPSCVTHIPSSCDLALLRLLRWSRNACARWASSGFHAVLGPPRWPTRIT